MENQEANDLAQTASGYKIAKDQPQEPIEIRNKRSSKESSSQQILVPKSGGIEPFPKGQGTNFIEILFINNLGDDDWRKPILNYLENLVGTTCRKVKYRALSYMIVGDELFKKTSEEVLLKCLGETEAYLTVSNTHNEACGAHQAGHKMKWMLFR